MQPINVEVRHFGCSQRFCIFDEREGWFENENGQARTYSQPGGATAFLRRTGYPWIVRMPSGRTVYINCENPALKEKFGPHQWHKVNLVTQSDRSGMYDVWRCDLCGKEMKQYGLAGRPNSGVCKKNPV